MPISVRKYGVLLPTAALAMGGCHRNTQKTDLIVFAAVSLKETFKGMAERYDFNHPQLQVVLNLAGSQDLALQIREKAPCDVFASADLRQMKAAEESGRIDPKEVREFAENKLVIVASQNSSVRSLDDLAKKGVKVILAAKEVPAGNYSLKMLDKVSPVFRGKVLKNVVSFEQDVRSVLTKVELGEADAGVVYETDAKVGNDIVEIPLPAKDQITSKYYIAPIRGSDHELALSFVSYVISRDGLRQLKAKGFSVPGVSK